MRTVYALLVGINTYASPSIASLRGCLNDVRHAYQWLAGNVGPDATLCPLLLRDDEATRDAIVDGIRVHLGKAGPQDTALFWFSGHGSDAECPEWAWFTEPTGRMQTLVCADSRTAAVPDLWDKELSVLLDDVAERAGHVAVILDSCHADGATRDIEPLEPDVRAVAPAGPRDLASLIAELSRDRARAEWPEHVSLAACRSFEKARETDQSGEWRGMFSWSLLRVLDRLGRSATYHDLAAAVRNEVEQRNFAQVPQLRPALSWLAELTFLGRDRVRSGAAMRMRFSRGGWEIDAGALHGLAQEPGLRVGVRGAAAPTREAEVIEVRTQRSAVQPRDGWEPDRDRQYPVVVTRMPLPPRTVSISGADPDLVRQLIQQFRTTAPDSGPSPHLRVVGPGPGADLRADVEPGGTVRVRDGRGRELAEVGFPHAVPAMEHIARWLVLSTLTNPSSELSGLVRIEVLEAAAGQPAAPRTGGTVPEAEDDGVRVSYRRTATGWQPPEVFIRLHNTSDRRLYCVLLDLTPRFRVHADLFTGDFIAPGARGVALRGRRITAYLPDGMPPTPGARVEDRLKLLVAEEQFSAEPFLLPRLGGRVSATRGMLDAPGLLERIGGTVVHRDLGDAEPVAAYDWTTETLSLTTVVPAEA